MPIFFVTSLSPVFVMIQLNNAFEWSPLKYIFKKYSNLSWNAVYEGSNAVSYVCILKEFLTICISVPHKLIMIKLSQNF